ncbi:hypothetical protein BH18THE1_BH18THE1_22650 [soil metagenome]
MLLVTILTIFSLTFGIALFYPNQAYPQTGNCDSAYPDICIKSPPPDLNCDDILSNDFRVLSPDPHGLDRNGDGVGCESAVPP